MSRTLTPEEEQSLLDAFEKMINDIEEQDSLDEEDEGDDFGTFGFPEYPSANDLIWPWDPNSPPPIPKEALSRNTCKHEKTKKVFYTDKEAYIMCVSCKEDLGDAK